MSLQYTDPYGNPYVRGWGQPDFTDEEKRKYQIGPYNWNSPYYEGSGIPGRGKFFGEPNYPGAKERKPRGLSRVVTGALDKLTGGFTDFDKRGDSPRQAARKEALLNRGRDFLRDFIFGTEKAKGPVPMPNPDTLPDTGGTPVPMPNPDNFPDGKGTPVPMPDPSEKSTTEKVEEFIGDKNYKLYTDKNTGEEFIPFDPRISGSKQDFNRYGQPLTEEQKKLMQQGARIGSFIPNPYTEEQMREIGKENLKLNL